MSNFNEPINKLNTETFSNKLNLKFNNRFSLLDNYINSTTQVKVKCNICNYIFSIRPASLLNRGRCPNCTKINKKKRINTWNKLTNEDFINKLKNQVNDEYTCLSEYTKAEDYVLMRHNICGY